MIIQEASVQEGTDPKQPQPQQQQQSAVVTSSANGQDEKKKEQEITNDNKM